MLGDFAPEIRAQSIFRDRFVGAVRTGHPLLASAVTPALYATCKHVVASRRGAFVGPVDDALGELGLRREITVVVPGFSDALRIARQSDLIALVPGSCARSADPVMEGLSVFDLPVPTPEIAISAMWHPRMDADPGHRWLRETVMATCRLASSLDRHCPPQARMQE
ncbi:LysR substrate-binding domain-containing protein [Sphingobium scionense]